MLYPPQVLHEEATIPGTDLRLSYLSSRAAGYKSVLKVTMTQAVIPFNLMKVHLMVAVVGRLFQKWFPASPNLAYTFIWDKTDAYNQKVYGLSEAVGEFRVNVLCSKQIVRPWLVSFSGQRVGPQTKALWVRFLVKGMQV